MSNLSNGKQLEEVLSLGAEKTVIKSDLSPKQLITMVRYELRNTN